MVITGRAFALAAVGLIPIMLTQRWAAVLAWAAVWVIVVALDAALAGTIDRLRVERASMGSVRLTESTSTELVIINDGTRHVRGVLRDAWQPTAGATDNRHRLDLPAGEAQRARTRLLPARRGDLGAVRVTVRSLGPLGVAGRQKSREVPGSLRVLPEFRSRRHLPSKLARLREMDGRSAVNIRGPGTEFDSLREYVPGDDVRAIDWRATARRQEVVVRTWRPERDRRVFIVVDTSRLSASRLGDEPRLDAGIDATLLLTALTSKAGDRVEVVAIDQQVRARATAAGSATVMATVASRLAPVFPSLVEADWPGVAQLVRDRLSQHAMVVLVTAVEPSAVDSGLLNVCAVLAQDHQVVVASATDPDAEELRTQRSTQAEIFDAAAAERASLERRAVASELRRLGVEVIERDPEHLAPALADCYLALKAAGRL